jgi:predicted transposase YbfD/YdcC
VFQVTDEQVVAIDGKTLRGSHDKHLGKEAIHMVSAWANANSIVLGQYKVDDKSNEITAIPALLKLLYVRGCLVTIDAMGCQKKIAQAVRDAHADYLLRVKDNQGQLHQDMVDWFAHAAQVQYAKMQHTYAETVNKQHGRIEIRRCWALSDPVAFEYIRHYDSRADLALLVRVEREHRWQGKRSHEIAYYISSRVQPAAAVLAATRHHWGVENSLHWVLDVTFNEDASRVRVGHSPQNFAVLRHITLNILKQDKSKGSLMQKRFKAALDTDFLFRLLHQF